MTDLLELAEEERPPGRGGRPKRSWIGRLIAVLFVLLLVLVLVVGLVVGLRFGIDKLSSSKPAGDYPGPGTGEAVIQIQPGDTAGDVADTLVAKDVVKSRRAFFEVASADPRALTLKPGFYKVRLQMNSAEALDLLLDPASKMIGRVTVPEGLTVPQTLEVLATGTKIPLEEFQRATTLPSELGLPGYAEGKLEGFLFPATYDIEPGTTAAQVLAKMIDRFEQAAQTVGLEQGAQRLGLTPYQVVVVASLIEREVKRDEEYPQVARVVYNRLKKNIPLGIDAAILFGVGKTAGGELTKSDLAKDTPYENRRRTGLPPTPIASPGEATLKGALNPVEGDILYYVLADKEGRTFFTADYDAFINQRDKSRAEGVF